MACYSTQRLRETCFWHQTVSAITVRVRPVVIHTMPATFHSTVHLYGRCLRNRTYRCFHTSHFCGRQVPCASEASSHIEDISEPNMDADYGKEPPACSHQTHLPSAAAAGPAGWQECTRIDSAQILGPHGGEACKCYQRYRSLRFS